ncbi:MAG: hypothetical protein AOA65_2352 [Candidatus Bathyarchaeota archaeon BA1]|nr:MAG: hypothetical protein AOA65_2352 [Candidatus Bathyarchaeota archaeon BA1]
MASFKSCKRGKWNLFRIENKNKRYNASRFNIYDELSILGIYELGLGTRSLAHLYRCSTGSIHNMLKAYSSIRLTEMRSTGNGTSRFYRFQNDAINVKPPLTSFVKNLKDQEYVEEFDKIICVLGLTDGFGCIHGEQGFVGISSNSCIIHEIFVDLMYYRFNVLPGSFFRGDPKQGYVTAYHNREIKSIVETLNAICIALKHSPAHHERAEAYLSKPQPSLKFLIQSKRKTRELGLRLAFSADGGCSLRIKRGYVYPDLFLACAHPILVYDWKRLAEEFGIRLSIKKGKTWSGYEMLRTQALSSAHKFLKIGGFIKGVKVTRHSPYYAGIDKQALLLGILKLNETIKENNDLKGLSLKEIHKRLSLSLRSERR